MGMVTRLANSKLQRDITSAHAGVPVTVARRTPLRGKSTVSLCSTYSKPVAPAQPEFHQRPGMVLENPKVEYVHADDDLDAVFLLDNTPLPKGAAAFSSLHIVAGKGAATAAKQASLRQSAAALGMKATTYSWPELQADDVEGEYNALFRIASDMILNGADRACLLVYVAGNGGETDMAIAAILGMLPFRGVQVAFVTSDVKLQDPLSTLRTASGLFEYTATQPERMGRAPLAAVFGPLETQTLRSDLSAWQPVCPDERSGETRNPFKIGGLKLPMVTFEGRYNDGVARLADILVDFFGEGFFPVCAVGESGDALGYGSDIQDALAVRSCPGYYFAHASSESSKHPDVFGPPELLEALVQAKLAGRKMVVIAIGGGVNGNAMGMIAALSGADFIEVPTTLMHYNDATTSAKKAFSLVVKGQILSKNILGTFYLPKLVFCISEVFLTLGTSSVHAAVGEAAKTMSMLGKASTKPGQQDFHNILGGSEFAGDFTRIISKAQGFEKFIEFLLRTEPVKSRVVAIGQKLRAACTAGRTDEVDSLRAERATVLAELRHVFHEVLAESPRREILSFLTVINEEVIRAKAMFLAYSDPFEKYRALLFEYAHTLGHGVEAFMNGLYRKAEAAGLDYSDAFRLHGQCVGMAVIWAGEMSKEMGHLEGEGYMAHQSLVYLFNRFGGFDFLPLRRLMDDLDVSRDEFTEGVLQVVRRDNKRGYCSCAEGASVDQLVRSRPGCLLRSSDPSAELRYLVEVTEASQRRVLERAFEGEYDKILVLQRSRVSAGDTATSKHGHLSLVARNDVVAKSGMAGGKSAVVAAARALDDLLQGLYSGKEEVAVDGEPRPICSPVQ